MTPVEGLKLHETGFFGAFDKINLNRQMAATAFSGAMKDGASGYANTLESLWNEDGAGYQAAANAAGSVATHGMHAALAVGFGYSAKKYALFGGAGKPFYNAKMLNGAIAIEGASGGWRSPSLRQGGLSGGWMSASDDMMEKLHPNIKSSYKGLPDISGKNILKVEENIGKKGVKGVFAPNSKSGLKGAGGKFIKRPFMFSGIGGIATTAAFLFGPSAIHGAFGMAGRLMDEANTAYQTGKRHYVDSRDFNNRATYMWDMQKQQSVQSSMLAYEQNTMSMARVYHSR
jgi:hypothetical protein